MGGDGSGRGGLSPRKVREAQRLLKDGVERRQVARQLGIAYDTVRRIHIGEHFHQLAAAVAQERCPGCGASLRQRPCLLCALRGTDPAP